MLSPQQRRDRAARTGRRIMTSGLVILAAGLFWLVTALRADTLVLSTGVPNRAISLPMSIPDGTALYATGDVDVASVECVVTGHRSFGGSAVPPMFDNTLEIAGVRHIHVARIPDTMGGREMTCEGGGAQAFVVAHDQRRSSLTFAVPLLIGGVLIGLAGLVTWRVFRRRDGGPS